MCAIHERLRGVFMTRRYTNPRLPLPLPMFNFVCQTGGDWNRRHVGCSGKDTAMPPMQG